ncbi:MAG: glutathione S-transferase family protein [Myxococcales bacterium]|nr:glutathione S-transferase family protein [Myxococcales bacterium]
MKLYGTTTSPFVRRVRIVAQEVGVTVARIDTATEAGQAELREVTPIRRVPIAVIDGRTLFDSRAIIDWLTTTRGYGEIAPPRDRWREGNLLNAIDAALDSVIQLFYLRRDGVAIDGTPFATRQLERADAIFAWLGAQPGLGMQFGLAELSLICALDWMDFRNTYPTERAASVAHLRIAFADHPSVLATKPHA